MLKRLFRWGGTLRPHGWRKDCCGFLKTLFAAIGEALSTEEAVPFSSLSALQGTEAKERKPRNRN